MKEVAFKLDIKAWERFQLWKENDRSDEITRMLKVIVC